MKINDLVTISPDHSLKFAGMDGIIKEIDSTRGLPLKIQFHKEGNSYWFSPEEIILKNS